jgi:hypothetical protein
MTAYLDRLGAVTDLEISGRAATYVTKDDPVANGAAAIRAVAEAAVVNPTWYSQWTGNIYVPVTDTSGNKFTVTIPGLTAVSGYLATIGPTTPVAVFPKWDKDYTWPAAQAAWPSNLLRFRAAYNSSDQQGQVPAMTLFVSVLAWGTR